MVNKKERMKLHPWIEEERKEYTKYGTAMSIGDHAALIAAAHARAEDREYRDSVWTGTVRFWDGEIQLAGHRKALEAFSVDGGATWHLLSQSQIQQVNYWTGRDGPIQKSAREGWMVDFANDVDMDAVPAVLAQVLTADKAAEFIDMLLEEHGLYKD